MRVLNASKDAVLAENVEECRTWWQQSRGMMFRKATPLVFYFRRPRRVRLHSWFCPTMDLVFLDDSWEVIDVHIDWPPFSSYKCTAPVSYVLELPRGTIWKTRTQIGDVVQLIKN